MPTSGGRACQASNSFPPTSWAERGVFRTQNPSKFSRFSSIMPTSWAEHYTLIVPTSWVEHRLRSLGGLNPCRPLGVEHVRRRAPFRRPPGSSERFFLAPFAAFKSLFIVPYWDRTPCASPLGLSTLSIKCVLCRPPGSNTSHSAEYLTFECVRADLLGRTLHTWPLSTPSPPLGH